MHCIILSQSKNTKTPIVKKLKNIKEYEVKVKDKNFTCFNKIERLHRIRLIADMYKNNLVHNNFYSFEGSRSDWIDNLLNIHPKVESYFSLKNFDFQIFDDPKVLFDAIREKNVILTS